jgi:hypothetical protein
MRFKRRTIRWRYDGKTPFWRAFYTKKGSFYQARLGTNIGKDEKQRSFLQVPDEFLTDPGCVGIQNELRRIYCALVLFTDRCVEATARTLEAASMMDDSVILFASDNGGSPGMGGHNMPLRGRKSSLFEGGVRSASFVWSRRWLPDVARGTVYTGVAHITDLLPTFLGLATGGAWSPDPQRELDGVDQVRKRSFLGHLYI